MEFNPPRLISRKKKYWLTCQRPLPIKAKSLSEIMRLSYLAYTRKLGV
jgi:hypothetical protein